MIKIEVLIPEYERRLFIKAKLTETARMIFENIRDAIGKEMNELEWEMISMDTYKRFSGDVSLGQLGAKSGETLLVMRRVS